MLKKTVVRIFARKTSRCVNSFRLICNRVLYQVNVVYLDPSQVAKRTGIYLPTGRYRYLLYVAGGTVQYVVDYSTVP